MLKKILFLSLIFLAVPTFTMEHDSGMTTRDGSTDVRPSIIA